MKENTKLWDINAVFILKAEFGKRRHTASLLPMVMSILRTGMKAEISLKLLLLTTCV